MAQNRYAKISTTQLAKICNVSQGTIDRALHDRGGIRPETKEKILSAARAYGYLPESEVPTHIGSALYGMVVFDLYNDSFSDLIMEFEAQCKRAGYSTVVMLSHKDLQAERDCISQLYHIGVEGIVLLSVGESEEYHTFLASLKIPILTVGNQIDGFPFVGIDNYAAMQDVTLACMEKGYQRLFYYAPVLQKAGTQNLSAQLLRHQAFIDCCIAHRIPYDCFHSPDALDDALADPALKTAVICPSDVYAAQIKAFVDRHPHKIGLIGFDNSPSAERLSLDSVDTANSILCEQLLRLLQRDGEIKDDYVPHKIVFRGSL